MALLVLFVLFLLPTLIVDSVACPIPPPEASAGTPGIPLLFLINRYLIANVQIGCLTFRLGHPSPPRVAIALTPP
jgi:hypothetical protein